MNWGQTMSSKHYFICNNCIEEYPCPTIQTIEKELQ